jgi:hypothetical protein
MFKRITIFLITLLLTCVSSNAAEFSAKAVVKRTEVYKGETFTFQIQVSGSDNPEQPDLSQLNDFTIRYLGGSQNSSSSITIINGKMTKNEKKGYIFNYQLTPQKTGTLLIPAIEVRSGNGLTQTSPIVIVARKPSETSDFKLRLSLSKNTCYEGEPVILTVTWYLGKDVRDFRFNLPLLSDDRFNFANPEVDTNSRKKLFRIPLGKDEVIGERGHGVLDDKEYTTLTFKKLLIPKKSGLIPIEQATVSCSALSGYSRRRNDPFSDFFDDDFFGSSRRAVYKTVVVPSNSLTLKVRDLPEKGRPPNFMGHIGKYKIKTSATPVKVNVGDPITLTITITGPEYLENVELPLLKTQKGFRDNFKIPDEMASAEIKGKNKVFTQTIRPLNSAVKEIPPVELSYFDTEKHEYRTARSDPIPLTVDETKVVTLLDAEGVAATGPAGKEIETLNKGIAFNYDDMTVIENERLTPLSWFKSAPFLIVIILLPLLYLTLFVCTFLYQKRNADPIRIRAKKSYKVLINSLNRARKSDSTSRLSILVLEAFREYLGAKLGLPPGALTFRDVHDHLRKRNIEGELLERLKDLFDNCEAGRYAGDNVLSGGASIAEKGMFLAKELEKVLK